MPDLARTARRVSDFGLRRRVADLEAGLEEQRQLSRRVAELTDLVTELLLPLADRDQESVDAVLTRYRTGL